MEQNLQTLLKLLFLAVLISPAQYRSTTLDRVVREYHVVNDTREHVHYHEVDFPFNETIYSVNYSNQPRENISQLQEKPGYLYHGTSYFVAVRVIKVNNKIYCQAFFMDRRKKFTANTVNDNSPGLFVITRDSKYFFTNRKGFDRSKCMDYNIFADVLGTLECHVLIRFEKENGTQLYKSLTVMTDESNTFSDNEKYVYRLVRAEKYLDLWDVKSQSFNILEDTYSVEIQTSQSLNTRSKISLSPNSFEGKVIKFQIKNEHIEPVFEDPKTPEEEESKAPEDNGTSTPKDNGTSTPEDNGTSTPKDNGTSTPKDNGITVLALSVSVIVCNLILIILSALVK